MRALVTHSGLQHSHQLAWALQEAHSLAGFWSGIPVIHSDEDRAPRVWRWFASRHASIPVAACRHPLRFPILRRVGLKVLRGAAASAWSHRVDRSFDRWVSDSLRDADFDMVICAENAAARTFAAARARGAVCVLAASSVHHSFMAEADAGALVRDPDWVNENKELEIGLAHAILTCSPLAASTFVNAGVPRAKVISVPLGADLPEGGGGVGRNDRECRFLYVGSIRRVKGVDLLLDAFARLRQEALHARLTLVGGGDEPDLLARARDLGVTVYPFVEQSRLFGLMREQDCLVLPSRFDGFGMVVPEAMAAGLPVIVSEAAGARCIVDESPSSGWVVPTDRDALHESMAWVASHPREREVASVAAQGASRNFSWSAYRRRAAAALAQVHHAARGAASNG